MKIQYLLVLLLLTVFSSNAQIKDAEPSLDLLEEYTLVNDSIGIRLDEIHILPKHKFKSRKEIRYYYWFRKKVFKAYPYALMASQRLDSLNNRLTNIKSKSKRKRYVKKVQKYVEGEFSDQLKKMSRTEGRVLIKLIHRQTGQTAFDNIKVLRSGWKAFWYNSTANVFKLSLKDEYKPDEVNEDYLIEDILQRAFIDEKLEFQASKLDFDSSKIIASKKGYVNVDEYIEMFAKRKKKKKKKIKK